MTVTGETLSDIVPALDNAESLNSAAPSFGHHFIVVVQHRMCGYHEGGRKVFKRVG
jgi:hypothetical protein